ncbi:MAG TPA: integrase arm-type DNA-binding domain-containing protein [Burkholderiales bacterium]|nr:integrase arm-type DNA-binding domain-containing protein [Burkholderiales bacterium]
MENAINRRVLNKLTDVKIRAFITKARTGKAPVAKLSDGGALYIMLTPAGTPVWRVKYRVKANEVLKERVYAVGKYPAISLEQARAERDAIKALLREGRDPVQARHLLRADGAAASENTFETVASDWFAKQRKDWSAIHYDKSSRAIERDVLPRLGKLPIKEIKPAMVSGVIEAIFKRGARDTAGKVLQHVSGIFRLAQARGLRDDNPAEPVHEVLPSRGRAGRMPALLTFPELGAVLRKADEAKLSPAVRMAHRLCAFTAARIGNIVEAEWSEFVLDAGVPTWVIPRHKMKSRDRHHDHKIILPRAIVKELREWREQVGSKRYVFASHAGAKHITRESLEKAYRVTLGLEGTHSPHGWRAAFSTLAKDHDFERDVVELALDHIHDNDVVRAYDRGERLQQRIKLMTWWGEQLSQAQRGADVVPMKGRAA